MARDAYERKISSEEAAEGYVLVEKAALKFFPAIGHRFGLIESGETASAKVEARDCECRGPEKPHQHYFIRRGGLAKGSRLRFTRAGAAYLVECQSPVGP
ncbi:hypothetical protein [Candidatus Amarobacter glycogenicus]|uniref:hypothetical protein n=1 Tax=Candidatus Amarobacter glycogenicus TaxID=3140699 RepID=UPI002A0D4C90|nr:hypothetical protein [Dehalococcoidia bacterium]